MKKYIRAILAVVVTLVIVAGCSYSKTNIKTGPDNKVAASEYKRVTFSIFGDKESAGSWSKAHNTVSSPTKTVSKRKPRIGSTGHMGPVRNKQ